jgi:uncharacterized repeat protein (TIGR03833 family)
MLKYISPKGYHYTQKRNGDVIRVSTSVKGGKDRCRKDGYTGEPPKKGGRVKIIVKPYHALKYVTGIVAAVLTKSRYHTRGHKVKLTCGAVGRMISFEKKSNVSRKRNIKLPT